MSSEHFNAVVTVFTSPLYVLWEFVRRPFQFYKIAMRKDAVLIGVSFVLWVLALELAIISNYLPSSLMQDTNYQEGMNIVSGPISGQLISFMRMIIGIACLIPAAYYLCRISRNSDSYLFLMNLGVLQTAVFGFFGIILVTPMYVFLTIGVTWERIVFSQNIQLYFGIALFITWMIVHGVNVRRILPTAKLKHIIIYLVILYVISLLANKFYLYLSDLWFKPKELAFDSVFG